MGAIAIQRFNGGIIFVSFIISVIGAMTTLELLTRRTHIQGRYNWYLLLSAALAMGSVGIWSMHFIGNNSLTLVFPNHTQPYQLAYSGGYTFASLVVAIACMFVSFSFVGVTEHVQTYRIILSGILAGSGIATMHYLGQFAIEYFQVVYNPPYVVGAVIIACTAVTAALWIFFKLREQWMNQWYKRLGCAIIMGVAVCGMHYTAMAGTEYYADDNGSPPPTPLLPTPALIGVICAIVVIACISLFYIGVKCSMRRLAENSEKAKRRLVVDLVLFDGSGRIMVDIGGLLPSREVLSDIQFKTTRQEFSSTHPLFVRLFQVVTQWSTIPTLEDYERTSHSGEFNTAERRFHEATSSLMESLHLNDASELGLLYESVIETHTIHRLSLFQQKRLAMKQGLKNFKSSFISSQVDDNATDYDDEYSLSETAPTTSCSNSWKPESKKTSFDQANVMESKVLGKKKVSSSTVRLEYKRHSSTQQFHSTEPSRVEGDEERHIVLVRQLTSDKDIHRFMAQGYRFAGPTFISKIMADKLHVPNEYLLNHFRDMMLLAQSSLRLTGDTSPRVLVGLMGLIDEGQTYDNVQMVVDKKSRYGIPIVDLTYKDTGEIVRQLSADDKQCLSHTFQDTTMKSHRFARALELASQRLIQVTGTNGMHLGLYGAVLQAEVLDIPAFALTTGPCSLILFRICLRTPGTIAAIQQHASIEPIRCIPSLLGVPLAYAITQRAADQYQKSTSKFSWGTELQQQMLYGNFARNQPGSLAYLPDIMTSLPPPPRVKRSRQPTTLDTTNNKSSTSPAATLSTKYQSMNEMESTLNILSAKDRFIWLDQVLVECLHSISS
ncbi:uncharacterized protein BX664DRAFT_287490 [Halteromyces radiatus]|uniref:uncharacterized protein n=1 Tax=Halteromyces radiatus TaxID=101107 RepID=UPI00221F8889|nr:uncharacterized protein BX664DRAFT_287490 [Halteromyces radiatus]KAI8077882.1 hypothetical protein BX664DRAFT_287490 [Halteromyces radiatus]